MIQSSSAMILVGTSLLKATGSHAAFHRDGVWECRRCTTRDPRIVPEIKHAVSGLKGTTKTYDAPESKFYIYSAKDPYALCRVNDKTRSGRMHYHRCKILGDCGNGTYTGRSIDNPDVTGIIPLHAEELLQDSRIETRKGQWGSYMLDGNHAVPDSQKTTVMINGTENPCPICKTNFDHRENYGGLIEIKQLEKRERERLEFRRKLPEYQSQLRGLFKKHFKKDNHQNRKYGLLNGSDPAISSWSGRGISHVPFDRKDKTSGICITEGTRYYYRKHHHGHMIFFTLTDKDIAEIEKLGEWVKPALAPLLQ